MVRITVDGISKLVSTTRQWDQKEDRAIGNKRGKDFKSSSIFLTFSTKLIRSFEQSRTS